MVFEDLHWADSGTLDFIEHLLEWSRSSPIFVITLARTDLLERRAEWGAGKRNFTSLYLDPLPEPSMRELLSAWCPGCRRTPCAAIIGRAEGSRSTPSRRCARCWPRAALALEGDRYVPRRDLAQLSVPETLQALIAARLDALDPADRSLVSLAAVLGQSFTLAGLAAVSGTPEDELEPRVRDLVRRELFVHIADPRSPERGQYAFVQGLIREVAYSMLAKRDREVAPPCRGSLLRVGADRRAVRRARAALLLGPREAPEGPEADALAAQARIALKAAAERAAQLGSHVQEISFLEGALSITADRPEEAELLPAGRGSSHAGRHDAADAFLDRAVATYRDLGDRKGAAGAIAMQGEVRLNAFRLRPALDVLEPAAKEFADFPASALVHLWSQLARARFLLEETELAVEWSDRTLAAAERLNLIPIVADTLATKGTALAEAGRPIEGSALLQAALRLADAHGLQYTAGRSHLNLSYMLSDVDPAEALASARAGLAHVRRYGAESLATTLVANFATTALRYGLWDEVQQEVTAELEREQDPVDRLTIIVYDAQLSSMRGESAEAALDECRSVSAEQSDPQLHAELHVSEAVVALAEGRLREAVRGARLRPQRPHRTRHWHSAWQGEPRCGPGT